MGWNDLLGKSRVVVLAEAGAGKSTELRSTAARLKAEGRTAFFVTVQAIGRRGFRGALLRQGAADLDAWLTSDGPAWFFIDSIDEGKWDQTRFDEAVAEIADGVAGGEGRCHIVFSGRYHDWDHAVDLATLVERLPVTVVDVSPPPSPDEILEKALRNVTVEPPKPPPGPDVVILAPLDADRVRRYARAKGVSDLDGFLQAIEEGGHWAFARRPLDLGWMVDFWQDHGRLGRLEEMLEASLTARLRDENPAYRAGDTLDADTAWRALETIGAALVLGQEVAVSLPSEEAEAGGSGLDLLDILPDLGRETIARLLARPAFEPGAIGRTRLHGDNEGDVRSYLAARWLRRLGQARESTRPIHDLLFVTQYVNDLVRPTLRGVAAWMSLWDPEIAREMARRDPEALIQLGDPAGLNLPVKREVLNLILDDYRRTPPRFRFLRHEGLARFGSDALSDDIRRAWPDTAGAQDARHFLLLLMWRGRIAACADLAEDAAIDAGADLITRQLAVNVVGEVGTGPQRQRVADAVLGDAASAPSLIWHSVEAFFPAHVSVAQVAQVIATTPAADTYGFRLQGRELMERAERADDLIALLEAALAAAGDPDDDPDEYALPTEGGRDGLVAGLTRLLQRVPEEELPPVAVAVYRYLNRGRFFSSDRGDELAELDAQMARTGARRRALFWAFVDDRRASAPDQAPSNTLQLQILGWRQALEQSDIAWLLADGVARAEPGDARLAANAAIETWRAIGSPPEVLNRIQLEAARREEMAAVVEALLAPRVDDPALTAQLAEMEAMRQKRAASRQAQLASWRTEIAEVRADPKAILQRAEDGGISRSFWLMWRLASGLVPSSNRFSIADFSPSAPVVGEVVVDVLEQALIANWRTFQPHLRSTRDAETINAIFDYDRMAIAGITVDAHRTPGWPQGLTPDEVRKATGFATLELNGLPKWMADLARTWPDLVAEVLLDELRAYLATASEDAFGLPQVLASAPVEVQRAVAPGVFAIVRDDPPRAKAQLRPLLSLVTADSGRLDAGLASLLAERAASATDIEMAAIYYRAGFVVAPGDSLAPFLQRLEALEPEAQTNLVVLVLPGVLGDAFGARSEGLPLPFRVLVQLVLTIFGAVRMEDDNYRPSGEVFAPNPRDHAEQARSGALTRLCDVPGRATYETLLRFADEDLIAIPPDRLRDMALDRALKDGDIVRWPARAIPDFERLHEHAPTNPADLQALALQRVEDMQASLFKDEFAQGVAFRQLQTEELVQLWIAERLRLKQSESYTVERESDRATRKSPDITLRARAVANVTLPIEIKVVDGMSLSEVIDALRLQLCAKYLPGPPTRHGVLLLVHQSPRARGWPHEGAILDLQGLIALVRAEAVAIAGETDVSPQPAVAVIDVSAIPLGGPLPV